MTGAGCGPSGIRPGRSAGERYGRGVSTSRREATRVRLLLAARSLLAETGIQGATVEAICDRAGFSRGAFYSNFADKDDLILALFDREKTATVGLLTAALDAELPGHSPGEDGLAALLRAVDHFLRTYPNDRESFLVHQEFVTHGIRGRAVAEVYREQWHGTRREFVRIIERAVEALDRPLAVPPEQAALLLIGTWEMVMRDAFLESDAPVADLAVASDLLTRVLLGLLGPAGR